MRRPNLSHAKARRARDLAVVVLALSLSGGCGGGNDDDEESTTTSEATETCTKVLALGCQGPNVERLQRHLRERVDRDVTVDGGFTDPTDLALRSFERFRCNPNVCTVDGRIEVDGPEWLALTRLPPLTTTTKPERSP